MKSIARIIITAASLAWPLAALADIGSTINTAISALPAEGGVVDVRGNSDRSIGTTIAVNKPVLLLLGAGTYSGSVNPLIKITAPAQVIGIGQKTNSPTEGTVLQTTSSNTAILNATATGALNLRSAAIQDLAIESTSSSAGVAIDLAGVSDVKIERVTIYSDTGGRLPFNVGIRIDETTVSSTTYAAVGIVLRDVFVRGNDVGLQAKSVSAHLVLDNCRFMQNTTNDVQLGTSTTDVTSFHAVGSTFEGANGVSSVTIARGVSVSFTDCYFENSGSAGYAIDVPSSLSGSARAWNISVRGSYFAGDGGAQTDATYAINLNFSSATLAVSDSYFAGYANPNYIVRNQASAKVLLVGNDQVESGSALASSMTNVSGFANYQSATGSTVNYLSKGLLLAPEPAAARPVCDATDHQPGLFWVTAGASGVKDTVQVCAKDANNAYAWRTLY